MLHNQDMFALDHFLDNVTREISVEKLEKFVNTIESDLEKWMQKFEWTREKLIENVKTKEQYLQCPIDKAHDRISSQNFEKHVQKCRMKSQNYTDQDIKDHLKSKKKPDGPFQIKIDETEQSNLFPIKNKKSELTHLLPIPFDPKLALKQLEENSDRDYAKTNKYLLINYTPEERLALHNLALEKSKTMGFPLNNWDQESFLTQNDQETTKNETNSSSYINETRDRKRRPKSYRTSGSKSYTASLRDLIQTQMSVLESLNEEKQKRSDKKKEKTF